MSRPPSTEIATLSPPASGAGRDVVIVGGGPAGAAAATLLVQAGRRVTLLERQRFPRFHIGESLLPATNDLFRRLGVDAQVRRAGFIVKRGASFYSEDGEAVCPIDFALSPRVAEPRTYQVSRERLDQILLDRARECGTEVLEGCRARQASFGPDGVEVAWGGDGSQGCLSARYLIDASGQAGFLAKRLGLRNRESGLGGVAVHAWFEGVARDAGAREGDIRIVSLEDLGWVWFIPLEGGITSVGLVAARERLKGRGEGFLEDRLAEIPLAETWLLGARRVSPVRRYADFSYHPGKYVGDRWLLAGDAGSFLDPVFSTGVLLALQGGVEAAEAVGVVLAAPERRRFRSRMASRALSRYDKLQRRRYRFFRQMVARFYDPAFRDLLLTPTSRPGMMEAIVTVLAGDWRPPLAMRARLGVFFSLVFAQRHWPLVPRRHRRDIPRTDDSDLEVLANV